MCRSTPVAMVLLLAASPPITSKVTTMAVSSHLSPRSDIPHEASATNRQEAARQAYRQSVADGKPLTGVALGRLFDRSPRWGTSRIAEVRSEDIASSNGNNTINPTLPIRNDRDGGAGLATYGKGSLPIGMNNGGNGNRGTAGSKRAARGNGRHRGEAAMPIGNNGDSVYTKQTADPEPAAPPMIPPGGPTASHDTPTVTTSVRRITTVAVLAVALVAGVASYDHQRLLAEIAGESWRAYLLPLSVDGLIVAASMSMLISRRAGEPAGALAWCALLLGLTASLAANVVAADPDLIDPVLVSRVVAAWPPLALGISFELSLRQLRSRSTRSPNQ
jgi:hypothetical protein